MSRILPILFNTDMVRAILDGRKIVTRRVIKFPEGQTGRLPESGKRDYIFYPGGIKYAPYQPGDILYVRETWQYLHELDGNEQIIENTGKYYYAATELLPSGEFIDSKGKTHESIPWRPSIHMPKEAARIWLKVTGVRAERLQDIDDNGILEEGLEIGCYFEDVWNSTIKKSDRGKYGWEANPWVWVIEFERCEKPESDR